MDAHEGEIVGLSWVNDCIQWIQIQTYTLSIISINHRTLGDLITVLVIHFTGHRLGMIDPDSYGLPWKHMDIKFRIKFNIPILQWKPGYWDADLLMFHYSTNLLGVTIRKGFFLGGDVFLKKGVTILSAWLTNSFQPVVLNCCSLSIKHTEGPSW